MEFCDWIRALEVSSSTSSFKTRKMIHKESAFLDQKKAQFMKGISVGVHGELPVLVTSCCAINYYNFLLKVTHSYYLKVSVFRNLGMACLGPLLRCLS